jgi:formylglycine-generating enzyme required for sulfatase activity
VEDSVLLENDNKIKGDMMRMLLFVLVITLFLMMGCEENSTESKVNYGEMVYVEGGSFEMGDHFNEGSSSALPLHEVTLNSFYIGHYEVTQGEYESVMGSNPALNYGVGNNYPIYYVTWYNAVEYCNALSEQEGLTPCYNLSDWSCDFGADGYRLPTEAEWEYAARGGVNWGDNYKYSGTTDNLGDYAVYYDNDPGGTAEVGSKLPNQLDIYDMSGNVWEWCNDWYSSSYYGSSPEDNPLGPDSGSYRVKRGGSWGLITYYCRVANRSGYDPGLSYYYIGFRILRAA